MRYVAPPREDAAAQKPNVVYGVYVLSQSFVRTGAWICPGKGLTAVHVPTQAEHVMGQRVEVAGGTVQRILEALNKPSQVITVSPAEQTRLNHVLAAQGL